MVIENGILKISADINGAKLLSVYDKRIKKELLYQPQKGVWDTGDIVIFPFCARTRDGYYTHEGRRYDVPLHGFIKDTRFDLEQQENNLMRFATRSTKEQRQMFPFDYEFLVTYLLEGDCLYTELCVNNPAATPLFFQLGAHPGYITDKGAYIDLMEEKHLTRYTLNDAGHFVTGAEGFCARIIPVEKPLFCKYKTLMLKGFSGGVVLVRADGVKIEFSLGAPEVLAFWTHETGGDFVCIEPWFGRPDDVNPVREFKAKPHTQKLEGGGTFAYRYATRFIC